MQDGEADEIGEKHVTSRRNLDVSPPPIFMEKSNKFNKSSPIKDLSFFDSDMVASKLELERHRRTVKNIPEFKDPQKVEKMRQKLLRGFTQVLNTEVNSHPHRQSKLSNNSKIGIQDHEDLVMMQPSSTKHLIENDCPPTQP